MMIACRLIALDKAPGFYPVSIRDIIFRLLAKCDLLETGATSTEAHRNINLYDGLGAGIEGAVNATLTEYYKALCPLVEEQALLSKGASVQGEGERSFNTGGGGGGG